MSVMSSGLSGLNAAGLQVATAAGNLANLNTDGYHARRVNFASTADGGVQAQAPTQDATEPVPGGSNVDPATEMVSLMGGANYTAANLAVLRVQDELAGLVLDMKA